MHTCGVHADVFQVYIHTLLHAYVNVPLQMLVEGQKHTYNIYQPNQIDPMPKRLK